MPTYRELLAAARAEIDEISTPEARALLDRDGGDAPLFVDVRAARRVGRGSPPRRIAPAARTTSSRASRR